MEALIFIYLLFLAGLIVLMWFIAKWFAEIAADKGYYDKKYFWICFWLGGIGWLMVVAMPNKSRTYTAPSQSAPTYQTPPYQAPPAYQNAPVYQQRPVTHDDLPPL
jgi:formate hydrogenlyase subunit 3/multisubunit Na+/H+ antiporter MnhD subunit